MNEATLFGYLRRAPFGGRLSQAQIDGVRRLLAECHARGVTQIDRQAYVLASVFHETGARMQPVREAFADSDAKAKRLLEAAWRAGRLASVRTPYWRDGWFGRGDIQITWRENYERMGRALGVDLAGRPQLALDPRISAKIAVVGMRDGLFAADHTLARYFPEGGQAQPVEARRIVNGRDKARLIAEHWRAIRDALAAAMEDRDPKGEPRADAPAADAEPDDRPAGRAPELWGAGGLLTSAIGALSNGYALAGFLFLVVLALVLGWAVKTGRISFNRKRPF